MNPPNMNMAAAAALWCVLRTHGGVQRPPFLGMGPRLLRALACALIASMLNLALLPLARALQWQRGQANAAQASAPDEEQYSRALQDIYARAAAGQTIEAQQGEALQAWAQGMQARHRALRAQWQAAGVAADIIARQDALHAAFEARHEQFMALYRAATTSTATAAQRQALADFLAQELPRAAPSGLNPSRLPWQVVPGAATQPQTSAAALAKKLWPEGASATPAKQAAPTTPAAKSASAPTAADLAETLDAPHTAAIAQRARDLGHNPHKIYQWVHDNIYWQPTHGSVQGAQDTLDKRAGNAFDTASLLIALLRASGIAARYVYGSVEIPPEQMMNWVGGAKTVSAAQQILAQGGIPNTALVSGGKIAAVRIEHVWVEALIQYHPGRGARHIPGQSSPDSWVPLDASFKQYTFDDGMDLQATVPFDAQALLDAAQRGAQSNAAEGWVQNLNSAAIQNQLQKYQSQLEKYIQNQNSGNSTVADVLGHKKAQIDPLPYLAGTLPYKITARTQQFSEVPGSLRAQFRYSIYSDARSSAWGDTPLLHWQAPTARLAGKKVTLAWVPASDADRQAIEALIPQGITDPGQLPRTIPASVRLKPQILLDGTVQAEGSGLAAGSEPVGAGAFHSN